MVFWDKYEKELNELLEDEKKVGFFCSLIKKSLSLNLQGGKEIIDQVYEFANKNKLSVVKGWMQYYLGWYYYEMSRNDDSIKCLYEALEEFSKTYDKIALAHVYNGLSFVYSKSGQYILANDCGLMGIGFAKYLEDVEILNTTLINIALNNINSGSMNEAREIIDYIRDNLYDKLDLRSKVVCLISSVDIELSIGTVEKAKEYIEQIEKIICDKKDIGIEVQFKILKAKVSNIDNNIENVVKYMESALNQCRTSESERLECGTLLEYGKILLRMNRKKDGIEKIKQAVEIAEKKVLNVIMLEGYYILYKYYKEKMDSVNSLGYLEKHMIIFDRINSYRNSKLIKKLDINLKDNELSLYKLLHDKTEILSSIGEKITSMLDLDELFMVMKDEINKLMKVDFLGVMTYNPDNKGVVFRTFDKKGYRIDTPGELNEDYHFSAHCIKNKKIIVIDNMVKEYRKYIKKLDLKDRGKSEPMSAVFLPLIIGDEVIGSMVVEAINENNYNNSDVNVLKVLGNYVSIAIKNAIEYKKMENKAIYDGMTGFLNKREIIKEGEKAQQESIKSGKLYSVIMIDMDDFKHINDEHGHIIGDKTIALVTKTINKQVRSSDIAGRYGGDEFLLVCPNLYKEDAAKLAERIRVAVESIRFVNNGKNVCPTVSAGVYQATEKDKSFVDVVKKADKLLYSVKRGTKNSVAIS